MSSIYSPEKDSYLMQDVLKKKLPSMLKVNPELRMLEIGPGSGIQMVAAKEAGVHVENIFSVEKNPEAVKHCKNMGFSCVESDLFENLKGKFDLIVFNPPYLPEDRREPKESRLASKEGKIFLLTSSLTKGISWGSYNKKLLAQDKIFQEELFVWELTI
jgi:methylase of polypeptide subunit release factors